MKLNKLLIPNKVLVTILLIVSFIGFLDASYLAIMHFQGVPPNCSVLEGCAQVTTSKYAVMAGIPVALLGALYYLTIFLLVIFYLETKKRAVLRLVSYLTIIGFLASGYFVYLQLFVISYICIYCMVSAITSTTLFVAGMLTRRDPLPEELSPPGVIGI